MPSTFQSRRIKRAQNGATTHPPKCWHPQGRHDDQLHALALATYAAKTKEPEALLLHAY